MDLELKNKEKMEILKKAVFVDDDQFVNSYHKQLSTKVKLARETLFFDNALKALEYLDGIDSSYDFPDLILVDINMPEIDGHEFTQKVSKISTYNPDKTMMAFLTNSRDITDVIKADEGSVEYYYWKPLSSKLINKVLYDGFRLRLSQVDL